MSLSQSKTSGESLVAKVLLQHANVHLIDVIRIERLFPHGIERVLFIGADLKRRENRDWHPNGTTDPVAGTIERLGFVSDIPSRMPRKRRLRATRFQ